MRNLFGRLGVGTFILFFAAGAVTGASLDDREALESYVDGLVGSLMKSNNSPSGTVAIMHRGELILSKGYGYQDVEQQVPVDPAKTLFRPGSVSKLFTWVSVMQLVEQGKLDLDVDVNDYLESFQIRDSFDQPITLRHIMTHTAGFEDGAVGYLIIDDPEKARPLAEAMERYQPARVNPPGKQTAYSNYATAIAGLIVQTVSGQPFNDYVREHIFEPLRMVDTHFVLPENKWPRLAQLYSPVGTEISWGKPWKLSASTDLEVADPELSRGYFDGSFFESGGAGLVSSTRDYLRFALMLLNEGELDGVRLLAPGTVRLLRSNHLQGIDSSELRGLGGFGLGVGITLDPAAESGELVPAGTFGWGGAAGTLAWIDPDNGIVGVFMTQSVPHQTTLSRRFQVLSYQAFLR